MKEQTMKEQIKKILKFHQEKTGCKLIKVTTTKYYQISAGTSTEPEVLIEEWFKKFPISRSHAGRDSSILVEHFNDDAEIILLE
jgi:hypothetical protein